MVYAGCNPVRKKNIFLPSDTSSYRFSLLPHWKSSEKLSHSVILNYCGFSTADYFHCVRSITDCAFCADVRCAETVFCPFHHICLRRMTAVNWQPNFLAIEKHVSQYVSTVNPIPQVFLVIHICCLINIGIT